MDDDIERGEHCFRAIWLSDIHLGTRGCKAAALLDFLKHHEADVYYLVGDILDGWQLRRSWFWSQLHNDVIQKILRKVRKGACVYYLPGNHDEFAHDFEGLAFGGILVQRDAIHTTINGKRLLVLHGDKFDSIVRHKKWLAHLGAAAYDVSIRVNHWFNIARRFLGMRYWSLSAYLKSRVKNAVQFMDDFEQAVVDEARSRGCDGVVCGHIHRADLRYVRGILYCNDGDWVESCTALVEHLDGRLEILTWADVGPSQVPDAIRTPVPTADAWVATTTALACDAGERPCWLNGARPPGDRAVTSRPVSRRAHP